MAEFIPIAKDKYKIEGIINEKDIEKINAFKNRTILILDNTQGLTSELISKINSLRVVFSIKGGLDYDKKAKYQDQKYIDRTYVSPFDLKKIINYFEYNESFIDKNWNEFEKAMFLYSSLVEDMEYGEEYENIQSLGTTERSLNGILYGKLVCSGFALVYKEMLDRVGIKNYYQNQKDVHAFNIIEIDNKKYGVDVTWDNNRKVNNNGRCGFQKFGHDPEFYTRHGHQLYKDIDISDDFEKEIIKRVYDTDEEEFTLSTLDMPKVQEYYQNIVLAINKRKMVKYDLQSQPLEIKYKYLPVDYIAFKLKEEAYKEYPLAVIIDFLKKRDALQINSELAKAFTSRMNYLMDIGSSKEEYRFGVSLKEIGLNGYELDRSGNVTFNNGKERRCNFKEGFNFSIAQISEEELKKLYNYLNTYLSQYLKNYLENIIKNLDILLNNYEYDPKNWDENRAIENANIYSKLMLITKSHNYLKELGFTEEQIKNMIEKINNKHDTIHKPYETTIKQEENDLDFLEAVFENINLIWQTMEYDLQRKIMGEEFISLYTNVDYMLDLFEKYMLIIQNKEFKFSDYTISKEKLQEILNNIAYKYQDEILKNIETKEIKR